MISPPSPATGRTATDQALGEDHERSNARTDAPAREFVALVGDIHGNPSSLSSIAAMKGVMAIVQLGDFGLPRHRIPVLAVPLYWIEGNHEQWSVVPPRDVRGLTETASGCFHVGRGAVLEIGGLRLLCGGGADSVDRAYQTRHGVWSEREQWTADDEQAMCAATDIDAILTHSPPQSVIAAHFDPNDLTRYFGLPNTWESPVAHAVDRVWAHHGFPPLYCGHMHRAVQHETARILDIGEVALLATRGVPTSVVLAVDFSRSFPNEARTP
jgi:hypothetical protein